MGSTSAPSAARQILAGVAAGKQRILVGTDSVIFDLLVRLLPQLFYNKLVFFTVLPTTLALVRLVGRRTLLSLLLLQAFIYYRNSKN